MMAPAVLWPVSLGVGFLVVGILVARRAGHDAVHGVSWLSAYGPTFIGAALAAFAGVHFTAAPTIAQLVPAFLPAPPAIAWLAGVAHLAAALSSWRCSRYCFTSRSS